MEYDKFMFELIYDKSIDSGRSSKSYMVAKSWSRVAEMWEETFSDTCELFSITLLGKCADLTEEADNET